HVHYPDLPSFPTRRSSDLHAVGIKRQLQAIDRAVYNAAVESEQKAAKRGNATDQDNKDLAFRCCFFCIHDLPPQQWWGCYIRKPDRKSTRLNSSHVKISYA